jgi:(p)ppGpp synthase/HD superfamily hydrolase
VAARRIGARFHRALVYAARLHEVQKRKGTNRPYIGHLLGVASIVMDYDGDEDEAIAALLHDAVEDQGGLPTLRTIRRKFGAHVAEIVWGCTDAHTFPKPPWLARKKAYLAHLRHDASRASASIRLVSAADKLHNVRQILADYKLVGENVWHRFSGRRDGTLWYYREVVKVLHTHGVTPLIAELTRTVRELERTARAR